MCLAITNQHRQLGFGLGLLVYYVTFEIN